MRRTVRRNLGGWPTHASRHLAMLIETGLIEKHFHGLRPFWRGATLSAPLFCATIVHLLCWYTRPSLGLEADLSGL